tara:strand:+ start:509 stop:1054 length:546 start_codon:yes stop_codon:yes gene_type:complete
MENVKSICVFCGSSNKVDEIYKNVARILGKIFAEAKIEIIFGGGNVGLMGELATSCIENNGKITGIIPKHLEKMEVSQQGLTKLHIVESMHIRKSMMFDLSQAIVVLPGGIGTLDEFFEVITWKQLNLHNKPIVLINLNNFWEPLIFLLKHLKNSNFTNINTTSFIKIVSSPHEVLPAIYE